MRDVNVYSRTQMTAVNRIITLMTLLEQPTLENVEEMLPKVETTLVLRRYEAFLLEMAELVLICLGLDR